MKQLTNYITEKFKINSKTSKKPPLESIFNYFGLYENDNNDDIKDAINKWINDNNINDVEAVAEDDSLKMASEFLDDDIVNKFSTDIKDIKYCKKELSNAEEIYKYNQKGESIFIYASNNIICIVGWYGFLYCIKK